MAPIRTSYAWLGAQITTLPDRVRRDRGEGPVSYIAVVLLIALIAAAIVASGVGGKISGYIVQAVDKVWQKGGGSS